jgi:hypothetical protein
LGGKSIHYANGSQYQLPDAAYDQSNHPVLSATDKNGSNRRFGIFGDGSAEFAGGWGNDNGIRLDNNGFNVRSDSGRGLGIYSGGNSDANRTITLNGDGSATFAGNIDAGNVFFNLEPDNPANYTTTTDSEGNETQVYNGPTLDVKERLTRTATALAALKAAAADNSTTLAELKSAFVAALADF